MYSTILLEYLTDIVSLRSAPKNLKFTPPPSPNTAAAPAATAVLRRTFHPTHHTRPQSQPEIRTKLNFIFSCSWMSISHC